MRNDPKKALAGALVLALLFGSRMARAEEAAEGNIYTLQDATGRILTQVAHAPSEGDEYISADNRRYRVHLVDEGARRALAVHVEDIVLPELALPVAASDWVPRVAIYCTHTDESYVPSSGTESEAEGGEILDVAQALTDHLNTLGCEAIMDDANHVPHDAGAYRRSRKTAVSLMKETLPTLLVDVHRDGVPADHYHTEVEGEEATKVRIVIGRGNQNREVNEKFALQVKAVADKLYPGLVKDIYLGKGSYNQDLMPRAILLEFGTHESDKDHVMESTEFMARVISSSLGATVEESTTPSAAASTTTASRTGTTLATTISSAAQSGSSSATTLPQGAPQSGTTGGGSSGTGLRSALVILAILGGVGLVALTVLGRGSGRAGRFFRELTGTGERKE